MVCFRWVWVGRGQRVDMGGSWLRSMRRRRRIFRAGTEKFEVVLVRMCEFSMRMRSCRAKQWQWQSFCCELRSAQQMGKVHVKSRDFGVVKKARVKSLIPRCQK